MTDEMASISLADLDLEQPEEFFPFETYKNYLQSLSLYIATHYGSGANCFSALRETCIQHGVLAGAQKLAHDTGRLEEIKKLLFNAWSTELVLALPSTISAEFVKYANHWSPVQAYYAVYLALQAYFRSIPLAPPPRDHSGSLRTISARIKGGNVFPPFWNVCCEGEPRLVAANYINLPSGISVVQINPLTTPALNDFWSRYAMMLRTTRQKQFDKKLKEAAKQFKTKEGKPRKRFRPQQKAAVLSGVHATTIFDFLYRLRIRSNYEDADAFILGTMGQADAREFNEALRLVTSSTLFLIELHIAWRISTDTMNSVVSAFIQADSKGLSHMTVGARQPLLIESPPEARTTT